MVSSRDSLIDELNDRVAVFEEDKVVLKAALRQLQKEMKEEGPKFKKMEGDLEVAQDGAFVVGRVFVCLFVVRRVFLFHKCLCVFS